MMSTVIDAMRSWFAANQIDLERDELCVAFTLAGDEDPSSARIDFESEEVFGRVTVWKGEMCDLEIITTESGQQRAWEHLDGVGAEQIGQVLTEFIQRFGRERRIQKEARNQHSFRD